MKKMFRFRQKLAVRITVIIVSALLICLSALTAVISISTSNELIVQQQSKMELLAKSNAVLVKETIEKIVNQQTILAYNIRSWDKLAEESRTDFLTEIIKQVNVGDVNTLNSYFILLPGSRAPRGMTIFSSGESSGITLASNYMLDGGQLDVAEQSSTLVVLDPYEKAIDGKVHKVLSIISPIIENGKTIGFIGNDVDTAVLNRSDYMDGGYESFYNLIICGHQTIINHTGNPEAVGSKYIDISTSQSPDLVLSVANSAEAKTFLDRSVDGTEEYRSCIPFYIGDSKMVWLSVSSASKVEFIAPVIKQLVTVISISLLTLFILAFLVFICIKRAIGPLSELEHAAKAMSEGNLHTVITYRGNDEIGSLAQSLKTSMEVLNSYVLDIDRAMSEMANGNFDLAPSQPFIGDFENIEKSITRFITAISNALYGVGSSANYVSDSSNQLSDSSQILSEGASEQAASIEELSATLITLSGQMKQNANNAQQAKKEASLSGQQIAESNRKMQEMIAAMNDISKKSGEIGKIIKTIDDIAFQTNILALNAAVEAARAGAAGKGFAVVADEVRNLSGKSAKAASNTTALIEETVRAVDRGTSIANDTASALAGVVSGTASMTKLIDDIAAVSDSQAIGITAVTGGMEEISKVVQQNSATAEESAAASEELSTQSGTLKALVGKFNIKKEAVKL